jgi:hypothetical protein
MEVNMTKGYYICVKITQRNFLKTSEGVGRHKRI